MTLASTAPLPSLGVGAIQTDAGNLTVSGIVSGTGSLNKSGAGTLTLTAANTYTGNTTVTAGTLALSRGEHQQHCEFPDAHCQRHAGPSPA